MYQAARKHRVVFTTLLILFSSPLAALDIDQLSWTETREKWGRVLFCQLIYKMPEVKPRLYDFDTKACDKAGQLMMSAAAKYSEQKQVQLKNQAEQHAVALTYNTNEPYQAVPACREYCQQLAEIQDKRND